MLTCQVWARSFTVLRKMSPQSQLIKVIGNIAYNPICVYVYTLILFKQHNTVKLLFSEERIKLVILYVNSI